MMDQEKEYAAWKKDEEDGRVPNTPQYDARIRREEYERSRWREGSIDLELLKRKISQQSLSKVEMEAIILRFIDE